MAKPRSEFCWNAVTHVCLQDAERRFREQVDTEVCSDTAVSFQFTPVNQIWRIVLLSHMTCQGQSLQKSLSEFV